MDYEHKYKEASERAETLYKTANGLRWVEQVFPELKESEDEKISKELIDFVKSRLAGFPQCEKFIAWIEKQGKQNPANKVELRFKVGDWIIFSENHNSVYQVERIDNYRYYLRHYLGGTLSVHFDNELIRLWTIQDAKDGDVLVFGEQLFLFKRMNTSNSFYAHCNYHFIGYDCLSVYDGSYSIDKIYPATEEQRYLLFQKIKEAGYEWDAKSKQLKKIEKKSIEGTFINVDEVRENFVKEVYRVLANDTTNDRANDIIYYFDSLPTIYLHANKPLPSDSDDFDMNYILKNQRRKTKIE